MAELAKTGDDAAVWHEHAAPADCALDDVDAWRAGNPGLADGIKSLDYMARQARRAVALSANEANFRAFDLNQPGDPDHERIVPIGEWIAGAVDELPVPAPGEPVCIGVDLGGATSMSAIVGYWPKSGVMRGRCAFPERSGPGGGLGLAARGRRDGVGDLYERMLDDGSLVLLGARVTDVRALIGGFVDEVRALKSILWVISADTYREADFREACHAAGIGADNYLLQGHGTGGISAQGAANVECFRRAFHRGRIVRARSLAAEEAIRDRRGHLRRALRILASTAASRAVESTGSPLPSSRPVRCVVWEARNPHYESRGERPPILHLLGGSHEYRETEAPRPRRAALRQLVVHRARLAVGGA